MAKKAPNSGKPWKDADIRKLEMVSDGNTRTRLIDGNPGYAVDYSYRMASEEELGLGSKNDSARERGSVGAEKRRL